MMTAMRPLIIVVALLAVGCGSSPMAPTSPASLTATGTLSVTGCQTSSTNSLSNCLNYAGAAQNTASGCAANVRGVTTTFDITTRVQVGTSAWNYGAMVRPNEQISYAGGPLTITGALFGGWFYTTTISWDNVACQ